MMVESEGGLPKCGHLAVLKALLQSCTQQHTVHVDDDKGRQLMYPMHK